MISSIQGKVASPRQQMQPKQDEGKMGTQPAVVRPSVQSFKALYIKNPKGIPAKILETIKDSVGIKALSEKLDVQVSHMRLFDDKKAAYSDFLDINVRKIQPNVPAAKNKSEVEFAYNLRTEDKYSKMKMPEFSEDKMSESIKEKFDLPITKEILRKTCATIIDETQVKVMQIRKMIDEIFNKKKEI